MAWWWLLQSYRGLSRAKFEVIKAIEPGAAGAVVLRRVAASWRAREGPARVWPRGNLWAWVRGYHELGAVERVVPLAFVAIYIAELIRQAMRCAISTSNQENGRRRVSCLSRR